MKYCVVILDGLSDFANIRTQNLTPLEVARTPSLDIMTIKGRMGMVQLIPSGLSCEPLVSAMATMGFDPSMYSTGKAAFEALARGVPVGSGDWVFACDLLSIYEGTLADDRAGLIRTAEAEVLFDDLNEYFADWPVSFFLGDSYRHLAVISGADFGELQAAVPYEIVGDSLTEHYPTGNGSEILIEIMEKAREVLQGHEINKIRCELGENPANSIWLWAGGTKPNIPSFHETLGLKGCIISAFPELQGLGKAMGLEIIKVPGITGLWNTKYAAKTEAALTALGTFDIVFLHIGALIDIGRYGDVTQKVRVLEQVDEKIVAPLQKELAAEGRIVVTGGQFISVEEKKGRPDPVPFAVWGSDLPASTGLAFTEKNARNVNLVVNPGHELLRFALGVADIRRK